MAASAPPTEPRMATTSMNVQKRFLNVILGSLGGEALIAAATVTSRVPTAWSGAG